MVNMEWIGVDQKKLLYLELDTFGTRRISQPPCVFFFVSLSLSLFVRMFEKKPTKIDVLFNETLSCENDSF